MTDYVSHVSGHGTPELYEKFAFTKEKIPTSLGCHWRCVWQCLFCVSFSVFCFSIKKVFVPI